MSLLPSKSGHRSKATNESLMTAWAVERWSAFSARDRGDTAAEWRHLERAHVLSQPMAVLHVRTHVAMLAAAWRRRDRPEVVGQLARILAAAPGSLSGRYPIGNTGGADVSAFLTMPIPDDLRAFFGNTSTNEVYS